MKTAVMVETVEYIKKTYSYSNQILQIYKNPETSIMFEMKHIAD